MAAELTAVLFALRREAGPFLSRRAGGNRPHVHVFGGMGKAAAARAIDELLASLPGVRRVISAGFCGGLIENAEIGEVVIGTDSLASVERPIVTIEERRALHAATGARIVDMESATIARRCEEAGIEFVSIRVVSDNLAYPLPEDLLPALNGEQIHTGRILAAMGRRPSLIVDLWKLARHSRLAANRLADTLEEYLR